MLPKRDPKPADCNGDAYMEGWFAGMDNGTQAPCGKDDNPYPKGDPQGARWLLGLLHGQEQDAEEGGEPKSMPRCPVSDESFTVTTTGPQCRCEESPYLCELHPPTEEDECT
jgi:hypothetical protein